MLRLSAELTTVCSVYIDIDKLQRMHYTVDETEVVWRSTAQKYTVYSMMQHSVTNATVKCDSHQQNCAPRHYISIAAPVLHEIVKDETVTDVTIVSVTVHIT
jgi:hypothetical protein